VKIMETGEINATSENILFAGTLLVNGDLKSRSTLRIGGDIIVTGIINSGNIICSGSVVALQGISGNGNTLKIEAHHNV
ncbi:MAG: FapA family protein, partial [Oscillospiraceae bacterium]